MTSTSAQPLCWGLPWKEPLLSGCCSVERMPLFGSCQSRPLGRASSTVCCGEQAIFPSLCQGPGPYLGHIMTIVSFLEISWGLTANSSQAGTGLQTTTLSSTAQGPCLAPGTQQQQWQPQDQRLWHFWDRVKAWGVVPIHTPGSCRCLLPQNLHTGCCLLCFHNTSCCHCISLWG